MRRTKAVLLALLLVGAVASFGGAGTFSSFSAETTNANSAIASGTLTLSNTVNDGTACLSASTSSANNLAEGCSALLTLTNVGPGQWNAGLQTATITVTNTGSIGASKFYLWAPTFSLTLATALTNGTSYSQLTVTSVPFPITAGDAIVLTDGADTQTFTATNSVLASPSQTNVSVTPATANFSYPTAATTVLDQTESSCQDVKTTAPGITGALAGTSLNFNPTTGNPLCGATLLYVEETTGGSHYCWLGSGSAPENTSGACTTPVSVDLTSALANATTYTSLPVTTLNGTVQSGDSLQLTCPVESTLSTGLAQGTSYTTLAVSALPAAVSANDPIELSTEESTTLATGLTKGTTTNTLSVSATPLAVSAGESIVVSDGSDTQTFVAASAAAAGATTVSVRPEVANFSYPATTSTVSDPSAWQVSQVFYASGAASAGATSVSVTSQAASATFPASTTTVTDQLPSAWAPVTQTFTASSSAYPGATSVPVTSQAASAACPSGSAVADTTAANALNSDTTDTITNFYSSHNTSGKIQLYPVVGNGQINTASALELPAGATRTFQVGLYLPAPTGLNQNQLQGLQSNFAMTWHVDQ